MSDEFDKEAEREKLRKKFERDEKKREHTQHMSELLLKGATMTNSHCDACGDPIFRHNGQEFCPTCSREGTGNAASANAADGTAAVDADTAAATPTGTEPTELEIDDDGSTGTAEPAAGNGTGAADSTAIGESGTTAADESGSAEIGGGREAGGAPNASAPNPASQNAAVPNAATSNATDATTSPSGADTADSGATQPTRNPGGNTPTEDLRAARESLARTARRFAEAADGTDDPRRAREHLQAAREAAEAIAALDR
jgi:uncharacterized Zn finger protein (UPF0148 family)